MARSDYKDADLAEHATTAWEAIQAEIVNLERWVSDPDSRVTRTAVLDRLRDVRREVLSSLKDLVADADEVLEAAKDEVRDECEEAIGSESNKIGIKERYLVALEILERDAGITETDIVRVARHFDPVRVLVRERSR